MSFIDSSSSNSQSSSPETEWLHDVFLTFRTNYPSIFSLQTSLSDAAIKTFIDDNGKITASLLQAIELSRIVIVVFTNDFVDSRNCLYKLEKVLECRKNMGKTVLALFCGVTPWKVRRQGGRFAALVTSLLSWRLPTSTNSDHSDTISEITFYIETYLGKTNLDILPHQVGIRFRVNEVLHLCKYYIIDVLDKEDVTVVGIWGIEGIGKTSIAKAIYDTISDNFECKSFLKNVKNILEKDNGLVCLQDQLISDISPAKQNKILDIEIGIRQIMEVLNMKRALLVFDDVGGIDQLIWTLCKSRQFGFGSMILITTRSKHLLDQLKVNYDYEMKKLDRSESLELLKWNAFRKFNPQHYSDKLAKGIIRYCEGLPLLLEVLGSLLSGSMISEWERVLKKLESIPTGQTQEKLKISYECLDDSVKDIFHNIAWFYVGEKKQHVTQKLSGFQFPVETGISMLIERSLLKVDMDGKLDMHDLLREIGKGINPNNPKPKYIYDVFLSFRGKDTRKSFATHLYVALKRAGIKVFMDDEIKSGKDISSSLIQAIESSRMSIIIFSINYAGSSWCLQELERIMECHRITGQEVFPIFYNVQPSDVRKQTGTFGKELERLIMKYPNIRDKKLSWTRALTEAANLSGRNSSHYKTDAELIDLVVETVTKKVDDKTYLFVAHHPVGVKSRVQEIIQFLSGKSYDTIIVGIVGIGGVGKTTIAKAIYNEIGKSFERKSFLADIREVWEHKNCQVNLQEQLLLDLTETRRTKQLSFAHGKAIMKERLYQKRALLVLDDVNNMDQLNALCGSREWFGPGSIIIVTTRDEHLLRILQVDKVFHMKEMDDNESLELFSWHAFKQASPLEDFIDLSRRAISYSEGLPLALEILGSYLFDRTIEAWESALDKLQEIPNGQIHEKLRISYDGLSDDGEKDIFLHICCFFNGKDRYYVTQILDGCRLHAEIGIIRLIELGLVKVDKNNKFDMHGLVCEMGREIIREESPKEPEKRTRLWYYYDVVDVLRNHMGTIAVNGLALNLSRTKTLPFDTKAFEMMKRLRLLQLGQVELTGSYEYLSKELRWLCWHGFSLHYMPENFDQGNIIALDLKYSNLKGVWKNCQLLERLKFLDLSHSHYLIKTPDFSKLPHLERLKLKDCPRLSLVHQSIGDLKYLIVVNLKNCKDLNHLPRSLYTSKSLKNLILSGCSKIEKLEEDIEQMESLTELEANETAIVQAPFAIVRLRSLNYVSLCGYEGFPRDVFPSLVRSWMFPTNIPRSFLQAFASMPFLLQSLLHSFSNKSTAKLETRPSTSQIPCAKTLVLSGFHDRVHMTGADNFLSSLIIIKLGEFNKVIDALLEKISQGWSNGGLGCYLPRDNYPNWLAFINEGSSISLEVSQVVARDLKGMILCILYSIHRDNMADLYPVSFIIKNFTKPSINFYKRDAATTTFDEEEWQKIRSDLEPGNEVEIKIDFAHKYPIKMTAVYLVYGEEIEKCSGLSITKRIME